ncbi:MAG: gephyrin-like molybdotransferase Glp [Pseudomonadota bacterium]
MTDFDTVIVVDWSSSSSLSPKSPSKDAIWIGRARRGRDVDALYCRGRKEAEAKIKQLIEQEQAAGRRTLIGFDFPFGYPAGFARCLTGSNDPLVLWDWFADRITDTEANENNRFDVAEEINAHFEGPGPLWGKSHKDRWPGVPYQKTGIAYDVIAERRVCDIAAKAASSCFQLAFHPTVGSQILMGLPMLSRLRRMQNVSVWPFEPVTDAQTVLVEVWPGLIEQAVREETKSAPQQQIRDEVQVRLLACALSRLEAKELADWMQDVPDVAREEAWILGAGRSARLSALARDGQASQAPPLRDDCFALPAGMTWTPVAEALETLKVQLSPVTTREILSVSEAAGRVLAEDVKASRSHPPLPNTAVDGYGFAGGRGAGLHELPLVSGRAAAGDAPTSVPEGHAIRVLTGAALPLGVDTVVLQEDVRVNAGRVAFHGPIKEGANARTAGEDVLRNDVISHAGTRLGPAGSALLAATGVRRVCVRAPLRVAVLSTGDEVVPAGTTARDGQVFDANRPMLLQMVSHFGHQAVDAGHALDTREALRTRLDAAAASADAILTSGGASAGDEDHVSALLTEAGTVTLWRVAVKPGRPLALGLWQGKPVFGLPGNPVAAMVCTLVFAHPALARLSGANWPVPQSYEVPAAFSKRKKEGRTEYLRARIMNGRAEVFASEGSGRISGLVWADGLVELPHQACEVTPGDHVRYIPFASFGLPA